MVGNTEKATAIATITISNVVIDSAAAPNMRTPAARDRQVEIYQNTLYLSINMISIAMNVKTRTKMTRKIM